MQNGYSACGVRETPIILFKTLSFGPRMWLPLPLFLSVFLLSSFMKLQQKPTLKNRIHKNLLFKSFFSRASCFEYHLYRKYMYFLLPGSFMREFFSDNFPLKKERVEGEDSKHEFMPKKKKLLENLGQPLQKKAVNV